MSRDALSSPRSFAPAGPALLTLLLLSGCAKDPALLNAPLGLQQAIIAGLKEPFFTLKYLGFIALIAPYALIVSRRRLDPLIYCALLLGGSTLAFYGGPLPGLAFAVALTVIFALVLQWTGSRFQRVSAPFIFLSGILHGYDLGSSIYRSDLLIHSVYAFSFALIMGVLAYGIGSFCERLAASSGEGYDSYENLVGAIVSGIALVYLVWSLRA